jgi:hypothetical protein
MHVSSSSYDIMQVTVAGWSVATGGLAGDHLSRPPGINVGPSDGELDQIAHSINAFSYARPVVHLVVPREGPVRRTRRITVDGANFGIQSRYIEVFVAGIAQRKHALGQTLVNTGGGEGGGLFAKESAVPVGGSDEICCSCDWYCVGYYFICSGLILYVYYIILHYNIYRYIRRYISFVHYIILLYNRYRYIRRYVSYVYI